MRVIPSTHLNNNPHSLKGLEAGKHLTRHHNMLLNLSILLKTFHSSMLRL